MKNFAAWVIRFRVIILSLITVVTVLWATQLPKLHIVTSFADLLPQTHPYIKIHKEFLQNFGGANQLIMLLEVKNKDIFNRTTLGKIKYITEELLTVSGIDRYKILSIAHQKFSTFKFTSWGIETDYLMWPDIPANDQGMKRLKDAIFSNQLYYGTFVSHDCKSSLITADFYEEKLDYALIYQGITRIRAAVEDDQHRLSIVGYPMHIGTIDHMVDKVNFILACTAVLIPILLFLSYRSLWATLLVPSAGFISAIWGLGFMGMLGHNLDPLIFVMPFLIALMAFRHSHQLYNRFYEEFIAHGDKQAAAKTVIEQMFLAGLTSILTDAFGIAIVAIISIPLLRNIAIACAFWSIITVLIGLILTPILLTYCPISKTFLKHIEKEREKEKQRTGLANKFADWLGPWLIDRRGRYTVWIVIIVSVCFSYYWSERLIVGDAEVGSNYLYPSSRYNQDSERINKTHPLINPLNIIVFGEKRYAIKTGRVVHDVHSFTRYMEKHSGAVGTQNIVKLLLGMNQGMHADDPKWYGFPDKEFDMIHLFQQLASGGDPGFVERFLDYHDQYTNIIVLFKDKTGPTIKRAIDTAKDFIEKHSILKDADAVSYKLAGGVIGVEAAINEVVAEKQLQTLLLALAGVFIFCSIQFVSFKAGLILTLPLILSNLIAFAYMAIFQIGLSISTLPVSAAGIGMGVDYGIYLLARLREEKRRNPALSLEQALIRTIQTYGKSIIYIAGTLVLGLVVWTFSPLKFQAQMGMMLAVILFLNCLGAIFMVPVLILLFRPKFLR
ncbi:MAG: MMPL family transporter [Deltaproteobacteria bacterium]|nr:MMPL family transporter [Deltaproteobacteria bacterium]